MDLYEALKSGTTEEDLLAAFHKDLDQARARIDEETAAAKREKNAEELDAARDALTNAILDYTRVLTRDEDETDAFWNEWFDSITDTLMDWEDQAINLLQMIEGFCKDVTLSKEDDSEGDKTDDSILYAFIKNLK